MMRASKERKRGGIARELHLPGGKKRKPIKRRAPINFLASAVTVLNLYCGLSSVFASIEGQFAKACYLILGAIVVDTLDGAVARVTKSVSDFGKELDSLCDVVSFGVAPAVLIYTVFLTDEKPFVLRIGAFLAIIYAICTALRLARFNVYQSNNRDYFTGLPSPAAAATLAAFVLFTQFTEMTVSPWIFGPLTGLLAWLMFSKIQYPKNKMKSLMLAPRTAIPMLAVCAVGIAVFDQAIRKDASIVLFPMTSAYVLFGIGDTAYRRFLRRGAPGSGEESDSSGGPTATTPSKSGEAR